MDQRDKERTEFLAEQQLVKGQ
jgi:hypothetical protein